MWEKNDQILTWFCLLMEFDFNWKESSVVILEMNFINLHKKKEKKK